METAGNMGMKAMRCVRRMARRLFVKEDGDSNIITVLVLSVVAVGLCIIFRNEVKEIIENVCTKTSEAINNLVSGAVS